MVTRGPGSRRGVARNASRLLKLEPQILRYTVAELSFLASNLPTTRNLRQA
jgi:hypothetical protein